MAILILSVLNLACLTLALVTLNLFAGMEFRVGNGLNIALLLALQATVSNELANARVGLEVFSSTNLGLEKLY